MKLDKNNPDRKSIINKIRKEGDFISGKVVPVQTKNTSNIKMAASEVLPCTHCKGKFENIN